MFTDANEIDSDLLSYASANEHLAAAETGSEWNEQDASPNATAGMPSVVSTLRLSRYRACAANPEPDGLLVS